MFLHTDTSDAPWTVIKSDCKKRARLNAMRYVLHRLPYNNKDLPTWQDSARLLLELGQAALGWLGQAAPVIVWTLWGLGAVLLLGAAGLMNLLVVLLRRRLPAAQAGMQGA
jgi:hypothetical protein